MNLLQAWSSMFVARSFMFAQGLEPSQMPVKLFEFLPPALSHVVSSPVGYMAMRYIPYPLYILVSSCKLIPVMIVGMLLNGNIPSLYDLGSATIMTIGIILYSFTQIFGGATKHTDTQHEAPTLLGYSLDETNALIVGILFTLTNLTLEGYTNASQDRIFNKVAANTSSSASTAETAKITGKKDDTVITTSVANDNSTDKATTKPSKSAPSKPQRIPSLWMQTAMNTLTSSILAIGMGIEYMVTPNKENTYIGYTLTFVHRHPEVLWHILSFALLGSFAQLFIYTTIENYGSFTTTTITISRKFVSVLLSVVIFHHILQWNQWLGVLCVFSGLGIQLTFGGKKRKTVTTPATASVVSSSSRDDHKGHTHKSIDTNNLDSNNDNTDAIDITRSISGTNENITTANANLRKRREDFSITGTNTVYGATVPLSPAKDDKPNTWEEPKKDV